MIEIYTDASISVKHSIATATCFIITPVNFIGFRTFTYNNVDTSTLGEIKGAIDGIKYAASIADLNSDEVVLFSDFPALASIANCNLNKTTRNQVLTYKDEVHELQEVVKKYNVKIQLIKGHQKSNNPNKVVDFISNSTLRYQIKGV